jgi:hypothetical protein
VRKSGNAITVTDGPFTEAKEVVGGFAILEARSKEHVIELAREFLQVAGDGECEIRQIYTAPDETTRNPVDLEAQLRDQFRV